MLPKAWFTPYAHAHTQAHAQILFNAFLPKHSHRVGTVNAHAHDQIKRYFARRNELEHQRERTVWITFSSQSHSNHCRGKMYCAASALWPVKRSGTLTKEFSFSLTIYLPRVSSSSNAMAIAASSLGEKRHMLPPPNNKMNWV